MRGGTARNKYAQGISAGSVRFSFSAAPIPFWGWGGGRFFWKRYLPVCFFLLAVQVPLVRLVIISVLVPFFFCCVPCTCFFSHPEGRDANARD